MQKSERTDAPEESQKSRPSSRRSSVSLPRKNSLKKEKDKKSPLNTPLAQSAHSTPKRNARPSLDFIVTGKPMLKSSDRANSLPGNKREPSESLPRGRKISELPDESEASREPSLDDDMSLDLTLTQALDLDDSFLKLGKQPLATSTPKPSEVGNSSATNEVSRKSVKQQKPRSASLHHMQQRVEKKSSTQQSLDSPRGGQSVDLPPKKGQHSVDMSSNKPSRDSTFSCSRDSLYKTTSSASAYKYGTDYSSVSPEYFQSSPEMSPRAAEPSPVLSSSCTQSWTERTVDGEWSSFWANYNNCPLPLPRPLNYDQCPTPYREQMDASDFEFSEQQRSRARSPEGIKQISNIIRHEGLRLTPRDAQRVIHCAHLLGSVLSRAVDNRARTPTPCPTDDKKRALTLNLQTAPVKTSETVTTQTDISLPNTKSAPLIFENILRQLSRSSVDEAEEKEEKEEGQNENQ